MLHRVMRLARRLDDAEIGLRRTNEAFFHIPGAGCEAVQAALGSLLKPGHDWFVPYYRDRALMLALGMTPEEMMLASVGAATDPGSGGRQIPSNWCSPRLNVASRSSCTGTQFLQAAGLAKGLAEGALVYVSAGEGTAAQGELWEMLFRVTRERLPVLCLIEDNGYAISVPSSVQYPGGDIARLLSGYEGLRVESVDGTDLDGCLARLAPVVAHVRAGAGPALVRATVTRPYGHSVSDDHTRYRTDAELAGERARDPVARLDLGAAACAEIDRAVDDAVAAARAAPRPDPATACDHLYGAPLGEGPVVHAHVRDLPIGQAYGMAMRGARPVVALDSVDDLWRAMMHVKNELATARYRSAGGFAAPVVVRVPVGPGGSEGETVFAKVPGLRVMAPWREADARGLLAAALAGGDPVIFCEPRGRFPAGWAEQVSVADARVEPGQARVARAGTDVTVVAWGWSVAVALAAAERAAGAAPSRGLSVEVLDLRTLAPWDAAGVLASVERTGRLVVLEHDVRAHGFGAEIVATVAREAFGALRQPPVRLGSAPTVEAVLETLAGYQ